jgi:hypothetical protein
LLLVAAEEGWVASLSAAVVAVQVVCKAELLPFLLALCIRQQLAPEALLHPHPLQMAVIVRFLLMVRLRLVVEEAAHTTTPLTTRQM